MITISNIIKKTYKVSLFGILAILAVFLKIQNQAPENGITAAYADVPAPAAGGGPGEPAGGDGPGGCPSDGPGGSGDCPGDGPGGS